MQHPEGDHMSNEPGWNPQQQPSQPQSPQSPQQHWAPPQNWGSQPPQNWGTPPPPEHGRTQQPGGYPPHDPQWGTPQYQPQYQGPGGPAPTGGLAPNIAAMLSYLLFGWIGGLIMYLTQKDREVRFHAAQSILTFGGLAILSLVITIVNFAAGGVFLLFTLSWLINIGSFILWIFLSIQGYYLRHVKLPLVGNLAEQWAAK